MNRLILFIGFVSCMLFSCNEKKDKLLISIPPDHSQISFANNLTENDTFNIIEYLYFYNGAGVSIGDINNDGLPDVYLVSNQQSNKLYLNKGALKFEDITSKAGVASLGNWKTGTTMADVNGDGWLDIYVCGVGNYKNFNTRNQLFINNGDLTFSERADEYGIAFKGFSTQAAFFDYDRDGDLDMYLLNHSVHSVRSYGKASLRHESDSLAGDRLYRNELIPEGQPRFTEVTKEAGIYSSPIGYGLGLGIGDVNSDGFPDIYVSNDFHENDYLYINRHDGTFNEISHKAFAHTSRFSMGNDIADVNNDLKLDIMSSDMLPRDEAIIKTSAGEDPYEIYQFKLKYGYHHQVSRNALQINQGIIDGVPFFTDMAPLAGVEATDWSWSPMFADLDGDGLKDLVITNGILRRPNNLDYINFISADSVQKRVSSSNRSVKNLIAEMPEGKVSNYFFRNTGGIAFVDESSGWLDNAPGISNGLASGDLDNDGDPDLVINNINKPATILKNQAVEKGAKFLSVKLFNYDKGNSWGIGSEVKVYSGNLAQMQSLNPSRGWCSSSDYKLVFGLGDSGTVDSIVVKWPNGKQQRLNNVNKSSLEIKYDSTKRNISERSPNQPLLFKRELPFKHREDEFNAFNRENLMPHMATKEGPPIAVADINGDGLEDFFVGGGKGQSGETFFQQANGEFVKSNQKALLADSLAEDVAAEWFDADEDGDSDLIVVSGGQEVMEKSDRITPRLYRNNGKGTLTRDQAFPKIYLNASCVKPFDYDNDGDVDIFIGSDVMPLLYGMAPQNYLLVNQGKGNFLMDPGWLGQSNFDNATRIRPGMVKDAVWMNVNNDNLTDLVLVGEWMPITILLQQNDHTFLNSTNEFGLGQSRGWWNCVTAGDVDNDGDTDIIAGNLGLNSRLKASAEKPLKMILGDFDSNGSSDHILLYYNGDKSYPFSSRDQLVRQLPHLKKKFLKYDAYKNVTLNDIVSEQERKRSAELTVDMLTSACFLNEGTRFVRHDLPREAQVSAVHALMLADINDDKNPDIILAGNFSASQPEYGAYDAGIGSILLGNGHGEFKPFPHEDSGFVVLGEARGIAGIKRPSAKKSILVSRNNDSILLYEENKNSKPVQ